MPDTPADNVTTLKPPKAGPPLPSDEELRKERAKKQTEAARKAKAEKAKADLDDDDDDDGEDKPKGKGKGKGAKEKDKPAPLTQEALRIACGALVSLCWLISGFGAFVFGYRVEKLTDDEHDELAESAMPIAKRFEMLALILTFLGFPVAFLRMLAAKLVPREDKKPEQKQEAKP